MEDGNPKIDTLKKNEKRGKKIRRNKCIIRFGLVLLSIYTSLIWYYLIFGFLDDYKFYTTFGPLWNMVTMYMCITVFAVTPFSTLFIAFNGVLFMFKDPIEMIKDYVVGIMEFSIITKIVFSFFILTGRSILTERLLEHRHLSFDELADPYELFARIYIRTKAAAPIHVFCQQFSEACIIAINGNSYEILVNFFIITSVFEVLVFLLIRRLNKLIIIMENENVAASNEYKATSDNLTTIVAVK